MFERLLRPLASLRGVRSVALLERDGYVIYRSAADASNDDAQRRRWPAMVAQNGGETVSLIFEHGKVVASQTKAGFLIVHTTPEVNLGALFPSLKAFNDSIQDMKRGNGRP